MAGCPCINDGPSQCIHRQHQLEMMDYRTKRWDVKSRRYVGRYNIEEENWDVCGYDQYTLCACKKFSNNKKCEWKLNIVDCKWQ